MPHVRVFPCPRCQEFIATDAKICRFCAAPIDAETAQSAADAQDKENGRYMRRRYARHMLIGAGLFAAGVVITLLTFSAAAYSEGGAHFVVLYGLILYGAGDFLYGLAGLLNLLG